MGNMSSAAACSGAHHERFALFFLYKCSRTHDEEGINKTVFRKKGKKKQILQRKKLASVLFVSLPHYFICILPFL